MPDPLKQLLGLLDPMRGLKQRLPQRDPQREALLAGLQWQPGQVPAPAAPDMPLFEAPVDFTIGALGLRDPLGPEATPAMGMGMAASVAGPLLYSRLANVLRAIPAKTAQAGKLLSVGKGASSGAERAAVGFEPLVQEMTQGGKVPVRPGEMAEQVAKRVPRFEHEILGGMETKVQQQRARINAERNAVVTKLNELTAKRRQGSLSATETQLFGELRDKAADLERQYDTLATRVDMDAPQYPTWLASTQQGSPTPEGYREFLLKDPTLAYEAPHFGDKGKGLIAHTRTSPLQTPSGEPVTFIEEVQSDYFQGLGDPAKPETIARTKRLLEKVQERAADVEQQLKVMRSTEGLATPKTEVDRLWDQQETLGRLAGRLTKRLAEFEANASKAAHPLAKDWQAYMLKQQLEQAVKEGKTGISWSTGAMQREVNQKPLEQITSIAWNRPERLVSAQTAQGPTQVGRAGNRRELADLLPKSTIKQLLHEGERRPSIGYPEGQTYVLNTSASPITLGGGFEQEYDQAIPNWLNKYMKRKGWETQVEETPLVAARRPLTEHERARTVKDEQNITQELASLPVSKATDWRAQTFAERRRDDLTQQLARVQDALAHGMPNTQKLRSPSTPKPLLRFTPKMIEDILKHGQEWLSLLPPAFAAQLLSQQAQPTRERAR